MSLPCCASLGHSFRSPFWVCVSLCVVRVTHTRALSLSLALARSLSLSLSLSRARAFVLCLSVSASLCLSACLASLPECGNGCLHDMAGNHWADHHHLADFYGHDSRRTNSVPHTSHQCLSMCMGVDASSCFVRHHDANGTDMGFSLRLPPCSCVLCHNTGDRLHSTSYRPIRYFFVAR